MSAPSDPISREDFGALRELVSGRIERVGADVRERLVAGGWALEDGGVYFLTERARDFMRAMLPEDVPSFYASLAALLFVLCAAAGCNIGAPFEADRADAGRSHSVDTGGEVLEDAAAPGDAGEVLDANRRRDASHDGASPPLDAGAGDAPLDAPDAGEPLDTGADDAPLDAPQDAGEPCEAGEVLHDNGVGQGFCDPEPLGTFDVVLVHDACKAFAAATPSAVCSGPPTGECAGASTATVSTAGAALCLTWSSGHVHDAGAGLCACPGPSDPPWR